ncbi:hypothetical protein SAMN05446037_102446 [Anaerovirgula multivorans]|uniref:DUF1287 domain-containing protein n=1 Tax=Anaerovirgula multivorans TaxID=312168 RepID=A0A239HXA8_9FIRM|nr:DUF1287 domain-containing protein [Anaerovirgula multivorans]SNS85912.1 hypothetical protein SAMN05446037_102446 [Anaerovirgula multivorans]
MKVKKSMLIFFSVILIGGFIFTFFFKSGLLLNSIGIHIENPFAKRINVPEDYVKTDSNNNGIPDPIDIVNTARKEVKKRTKYKSAYYEGGYPPDDEGVCTDVIWRGLLGANINLKNLIDEDIKENLELYPRVNGKPEPNIDFRRVPNQYIYFERFTHALTTELIPGDVENLRQWQPGDIVVFLEGFHHVAIISDKRAKDGTPYIIHNNPPFAVEVKLRSIDAPIAGHYRWIY